MVKKLRRIHVSCVGSCRLKKNTKAPRKKRKRLTVHTRSLTVYTPNAHLPAINPAAQLFNHEAPDSNLKTNSTLWYFTVSSASATVANQMYLINYVPSGTADGQRIGRQIRVKLVEWIGSVTCTADATIRLIVVLDTRSIGGYLVPDISDIYTATVFGFRQVSTMYRFNVLYDSKPQSLILNADTERRNFSGSVKVDIPTQFGADTYNDPQDMYSPRVFICCMSTGSTTVSMNARMQYLDN